MMAVEDGSEESSEDILFEAMLALRAVLVSVERALFLENAPMHKRIQVCDAIKAAYYAVERQMINTNKA